MSQEARQAQTEMLRNAEVMNRQCTERPEGLPALALRLGLWLLMLFAVVETPLGTGALYGQAPNRGGGLAAAELPVRFATPVVVGRENAAISAREVIRSAILALPDAEADTIVSIDRLPPRLAGEGPSPYSRLLRTALPPAYDAQAPPLA
jgi:hypothetical protein